MHTGRVLFYCFLFASLAATAKQTHDTQQRPARSQASVGSRNAGPITIRGCIDGGKQRYTLTQQSTATTFELQGETTRFDSFRGKPVEITGREAPPLAKSGANDLPRLVVDQVHGIGGECPFVERGTASPPTSMPLSIPEARHPSPPTQQPTAATPRYEKPGAPNETPPSVGNNPNGSGTSGAPSPGTGNTPAQPPSRPPK